MALLTYFPEMKEAKPAAKFEARANRDGSYDVQTTTAADRIPKGVGIRFERTLTSSDLVPEAQHKVGRHEYRLTERAFSIFTKANEVSMESLL